MEENKLDVFLTLVKLVMPNPKIKKVRIRGCAFKICIQYKFFHFTVKDEGALLTAKLILKPFSTGGLLALMDNIDQINHLVCFNGGLIDMPLIPLSEKVCSLGLWGIFRSLLTSRYGASVGETISEYQLALKLEGVAFTFQKPTSNRIFVIPSSTGKINTSSPELLVHILNDIEKIALNLYL